MCLAQNIMQQRGSATLHCISIAADVSTLTRQQHELLAGATFTEVGAANHGNCSELDFQESYKIHVASTVATTQVHVV